MRLIDADALRESVLKWLPSDPCGQEDKEHPFETDICVSILQEIEEAPTIEPGYSMDEWCTDCKEYDQEQHCCPRFNRVIRETVDEVKNNQWIPCSERLPEEKDAEKVLKKLGTSKRSEYVLATLEANGARTTITACTYDGEWDWRMKLAFRDYKIIAWMPLPDPWKGDK